VPATHAHTWSRGGIAQPVLFAACAVAFVEAVLFTALSPLLPDFVERFSISKTGAGILAAAYPLGALLAAIPSIYVARRLGLKRTSVVSLVLLAVASAAFALATTAAVVFAARFFQGAGASLAYTGALSWLTATVAPSRRAEAIGVAFSAAFVGALLGPLLGALADLAGLAPVFLATAAGVLVLAGVTAVLPPAVLEDAPPPPLARLAADPTVVLSFWLIALAGALLGIFGVLIPLHLDDLGWGAFAIGGLFAAASVVAALCSPFVGRFADRAGRGLPLQLGLGLAAVAAAGLALGTGAWTYAPVAIAAAVAVSVLWTPAMALLADAVERRGYDQATGFGITNAAWSPGFAVGAGIGAALAAAYGDAFTLLLAAGVCVATVVVLRLRPLPPGAVP
jgi:MFS family permease